MKTLLPLMIVALLLAACGSKEDSRDSFYRKAENHYTAGRDDDAVLELKNALRIDPKFAQGYMLQGKILLRKGDMRGAYGNFNQAVEVDPELLEARAYLGQLYLAAGQLDKAEEQDQAILAKDPSLGRGILLRAGILGRKGQPGQAMVMVRELLAKEPENDEAYLLLGLCTGRPGIRPVRSRPWPRAASAFRRTNPCA
jgi:tetratricopeptide (TPR) repeat protein